MTKNDCIDVFNAMIRGTPISFNEKILPLISDYLTENNIENSEEMINLIVQNPNLAQQIMPKVVNYFSDKYTILSIVINNNNFSKTILYYE